MPLGWRACKVLYSSSGSLIHHQPRTIAGKDRYELHSMLKIRQTQILLAFSTESNTITKHHVHLSCTFLYTKWEWGFINPRISSDLSYCLGIVKCGSSQNKLKETNVSLRLLAQNYDTLFTLYLHAGMGLTTSCVKYCCSSSWNTEFGGRPRRLAAAPRGPLRAGLLPLLPLLRLRPGLAGMIAVVGAGGMGAGRS